MMLRSLTPRRAPSSSALCMLRSASCVARTTLTGLVEPSDLDRMSRMPAAVTTARLIGLERPEAFRFVLLLNIPMLVGVIAQGRWSPLTRRIQSGLGLVTCAVMAWTVADGPVFVTPVTDRTAKLFLVLIVVFMLVDLGIKRYRRVRPAPALGNLDLRGPGPYT